VYEVFVDLFGVGGDAPVFAVDDDAHEIHARGGEVILRDGAEEDGAEKRGVAVGVQEIEGAVAKEILSGVDVVEGEVEGAFGAGAHHHVGRGAAEVDADIAVGFAVDGERDGDFDVGVVEVFEFLFPVGGFEGEEERAERGGIVEGSLGVVDFDVGGGEGHAGRGGFGAAATATGAAAGKAAGWAAATAAETAADGVSFNAFREFLEIESFWRCTPERIST